MTVCSLCTANKTIQDRELKVSMNIDTGPEKVMGVGGGWPRQLFPGWAVECCQGVVVVPMSVINTNNVG